MAVEFGPSLDSDFEYSSHDSKMSTLDDKHGLSTFESSTICNRDAVLSSRSRYISLQSRTRNTNRRPIVRCARSPCVSTFREHACALRLGKHSPCVYKTPQGYAVLYARFLASRRRSTHLRGYEHCLLILAGKPYGVQEKQAHAAHILQGSLHEKCLPPLGRHFARIAAESVYYMYPCRK